LHNKLKNRHAKKRFLEKLSRPPNFLKFWWVKESSERENVYHILFYG